MEDLLDISARLSRRAQEVLRESDIIGIWESIGAKPNLIGSAKMGLMMNHMDIDLHIYSSPLELSSSFEAMSRLAANPGMKQMMFMNQMETEEECVEWHVMYEAKNGELWKMDMIHIRGGSAYDGYMERVSDRIMKLLTPETKEAILRLKHETPEERSVPGIFYYKAVIADGIRTYADFLRWLEVNPTDCVLQWVP